MLKLNCARGVRYVYCLVSFFHFRIFVRKEPAWVKFIAGFLLRLGLVFLEGFNINKPISNLGL
jgi:hypothetical protein